MSLAHQRGGTKGAFSTIIIVAEPLTLVPSGCLLIANSNPLPEFALQTLHSSTQPLAHISGWGTQGIAWTMCVGLTLSCLPQTGCCTLFWAPLLSQLISLPVRELPQMWDPLLSFSRPQGHKCLPASFPSSFSLLTLVLPGYSGNLSYPFRCLRSSARVQQLLCEICSNLRCILDTFMVRSEIPCPPPPLPFYSSWFDLLVLGLFWLPTSSWITFEKFYFSMELSTWSNSVIFHNCYVTNHPKT